VDSLISDKTEALRKRVSKVQKYNDASTVESSSLSVSYFNRFVDFLREYEHLIVSFIFFVFFVAAGTYYYATYEKCSCSYGVTRAPGCIDGVDVIGGTTVDGVTKTDRCAATGGYVKTWTDAFYMSVITLTTVGFGDHAPRSDHGRAVGCVWMLFGVVATANFASAVGAVILGAQRNEHRLGKVTEEIYQKIDTNKDGVIDRREFRMYALLKFGLVSEEQLDEIDNLFDTIDSDGNGTLTRDEVAAHCDTD